MKRIIFIVFIQLFVITNICNAQKKYMKYAIGFYNQENLFDTIHDEGKNDYDFLPTGSYKWNGLKYQHKLNNMSQTLADMGTDEIPWGCSIIGLSEIENEHVLKDLVAQKPLADRGIKYLHIEGPDKRGVDCALLYNPKFFKPNSCKLVPYIYELPEDKNRVTRGFLTITGNLGGENIAVIVCHLPSRFAGSYYRELGGKQVKVVKDSLQKLDPNIKIFIMGDMNDDPQDKSMSEALGGRREIKDVEKFGLYNPWWNILANGTGTLMYDGEWNLFDQIMITENMLNKSQIDSNNKKNKKTNEEISIHDCTKLTYYKHHIFKRDYLINQEGKYKGGPKRTTAGGTWLDGFSDHLPVVLYVYKEIN